MAHVTAARSRGCYTNSCEEDGYVTVDTGGMSMAAVGLSASLRDLARFGELMRLEGEWNGPQLIPASVVHDVQEDSQRAKYLYRVASVIW